MLITHRNSDAIDIVELEGRLVMADAPEARQQLKTIIEQGQGKLIVDLKGVGFMDSSGLSVLISAYKAMRVKQGNMVLLHLSPPVQSLIELTRLQQVFEIFSDEPAAIAHLG
jgi:anti-sigma B factor antagonist